MYAGRGAPTGGPNLVADIDLNALQTALAMVDASSKRPKGSRSDLLEILLLKLEQIKLKMYQERGHRRPHFHVDYGPSNHSASYGIDTGERIEGHMPRKYDHAISSWATK